MNVVPIVLTLEKQSVHSPIDRNIITSSEETSAYETYQEHLTTVHLPV